MSQPHFHAWWEDEKPGRPLPEHLERLLERNDSAFLPELFRFAYEEVQPYYRAKYHCFLWEKEHDFSWIWTLYLHPHPLARQGFLALLADYSAQELDDILEIQFFKKEFGRRSSLNNYYSPYYFYRDRRFTLLSQRGLYYPYLKGIYKRAEKTKDHETWARLAFRFDTEKRSEYLYGRFRHSMRTLRYLQRRSWRFLRQMGENRSPDYVKWASEVLLHYRFDNTLPYTYQNVEKEAVNQTYLHLWLYNHILFHNSKRFVYRDKRWLRVSDETFCEEREEAFSELWDQPEARESLWRLVTEAQTSPVVEFAGRVLLQGHAEFIDQLSPRQIDTLFKSSLPGRRALGARLKMERLLPDIPSEKWIKYLKNTDPVIHREAVYLIRRHHQRIPLEKQQQLLSSLLQNCEQKLSLFTPDVIALLQEEWRSILLSVIHPNTWRQMMQVNNLSLQVLALDILKEADLASFEVTLHDLLPFLEGDTFELRQKAQEVVEQQFENLNWNAELLFTLLTLPKEDTRDLVLRLCQERSDWLKPYAQELFQKCWTRVIREEIEDTLRDYIRDSLLQKLLSDELKNLSLERILLLLESDQRAMQDWGIELLHAQPIEAFAPTWSQLNALAHCRLAQIRQEARTWLKQREQEWTAQRIANLLETHWDDTRHWMISEIQSLEQIDPELIYALLDTARTDIQTLAMELAQKHEAELDLRELALRASESPYLHVQTYALTLLQQILWDIELWERLSFFFRTVLLHVNKGRRAKELALYQLARLSTDDQLAPRIVPLLNDVARNSGKHDFSRILTLLTQIKKRYPHLETAISIR